MQPNEDNTWFANPGISQVHPPAPHHQPPTTNPLNPPLGKFSDGAIVVGDTTNCPARVDECRVVGGILFSASSKWESIGAVVDL